jgi:hypothetical protein
MKSNSNDIEGRSSAPCSRSSTPESSEAWDAVSRTLDGMYDSRVPISAYAYAMSDHSKKMERERDAAIAALMAIEERYIDGCDTYEDWKFMGDTARAFLSENTKDHQREASGESDCS